MWKRNRKTITARRDGWLQRNSVFQMQQDWCASELSVCGCKHKSCTVSNQMRSKHRGSKYRLSPIKSYLQLIPNGKVKISFSLIESHWVCTSHFRLGPMLCGIWQIQNDLNGIVCFLSYFVLFGHFCLSGFCLFILSCVFVETLCLCFLVLLFCFCVCPSVLVGRM